MRRGTAFTLIALLLVIIGAMVVQLLAAQAS